VDFVAKKGFVRAFRVFRGWIFSSTTFADFVAKKDFRGYSLCG
jgi:hypothetical protein